MNSIVRNLKSFSGSLLVLALMLIALFWVLNLGARSRLPVVSNISQFGEKYAQPGAYSTMGPAI